MNTSTPLAYWLNLPLLELAQWFSVYADLQDEIQVKIDAARKEAEQAGKQ